MKIGIASDHGGYEIKQLLKQFLITQNYTVVDFGNYINDPEDDYPDFIIPLSKAISSGIVERGIALCGSGVGASIAANKIDGVRAALVHDHFSARQGVEDDAMNVLCLGGRVIGVEKAIDLTQTFLQSEFSFAVRHKRRLDKIEFPANNFFG